MSVRFAPSPTGRFHIGNLRTAWISRQIAKILGMPWIVRFEDIDQPRVFPGAQDQQLADLKALNLVPDQIVIQSENHARHLSLFENAVEAGVVYPCTCSRKEVQSELQSMASAPHQAPASDWIYHGHCREPKNRRPGIHVTTAWRFSDPGDLGGHRDFVIGRTQSAEFFPAYVWACAIDDWDGDHRVLVRAWDLEHVILQQRQIYDWVSSFEKLDRKYPDVYHTSVVTDVSGHRLEKRTQGVTLPELLSSGWSADSLCEYFARGWDFIGLQGETERSIKFDSFQRPLVR